MCKFPLIIWRDHENVLLNLIYFLEKPFKLHGLTHPQEISHQPIVT